MLRLALGTVRPNALNVAYKPTGLIINHLRLMHLDSLRKTMTKPSSVVVKAAATVNSGEPKPLAHSEFRSLGISNELLAALQERGIAEPTEIQTISVPSVLRDRKSDFLIASHTGSGKTLAYLLPIGWYFSYVL